MTQPLDSATTVGARMVELLEQLVFPRLYLR